MHGQICNLHALDSSNRTKSAYALHLVQLAITGMGMMMVSVCVPATTAQDQHVPCASSISATPNARMR